MNALRLVEGSDAFLGGANLALPFSVVVRTKSTIACLAGPSFHEGSGSWAFALVELAATSTNMARAEKITFIR